MRTIFCWPSGVVASVGRARETRRRNARERMGRKVTSVMRLCVEEINSIEKRPESGKRITFSIALSLSVGFSSGDVGRKEKERGRAKAIGYFPVFGYLLP